MNKTKVLGYMGKRGWERGQTPIYSIAIRRTDHPPIGSVIHIKGGHKIIVETIEFFTRESVIQHKEKFDCLVVEEVHIKGEYV